MWSQITPDKWVLDIVTGGYKVQFLSQPKTPMTAPNPPTDLDGMAVLDKEVEAMLAKRAIRRVDGNPDGVVSPFFARPLQASGDQYSP
jgi:hypothetical protein